MEINNDLQRAIELANERAEPQVVCHDGDRFFLVHAGGSVDLCQVVRRVGEPLVHATPSAPVEYRLLEIGEQINYGDEVQETGGVWHPCTISIGLVVLSYMEGYYRRPLHATLSAPLSPVDATDVIA